MRAKIKTLLYFAALALCFFAQLIFGHYQAFGSVLVSSIITNPSAFWGFYLPKLSAAVILVSVFAFFNSRRGIVLASVVLDVWILAELVYYRVNGIFLDQYSFTMVGNMKGFWASVISFIHFSDLILLLFPFAGWLITRLLYFKTRKLLPVLLFLIGILLHVVGDISLQMPRGKKSFELHVPVYSPNKYEFWGWTSSAYLNKTSFIHSFVYDLSQLAMMIGDDDGYSMAQQDIDSMSQFVSSISNTRPTKNIVIILVESLENWAIGRESTPNLCSFMERHPSYLWATRVKKETKAGTSADGQMIVNTGLLPISEGAVCYRYSDRKFPSISEVYDNSAIIFPGDLSVWNQARMNVAYGIDTSMDFATNDDRIIMNCLCNMMNDYPYILALTIASHSPFQAFSNTCPVASEPGMPSYMKNYINCIHYTDTCLAEFLSLAEQNGYMDNTVIVITGDHTIFDETSRKSFGEYCTTKGSAYSAIEDYCPLLVFSPSIDGPHVVDTPCYQMDIFPTIMNLIGCGDYYWKGFGIDLLNESSQRMISEEDAYALSDKVIRADYFRQLYE